MFRDSLEAGARAVAAHFDHVLKDAADLPVLHAMRYATTGGKGLRGWLVLEGARMHDVAPERALWPACAIEAIHAYSLVHDDLPCMDDDDLRRGLPTVHRKWDEATAVLAGDALQALGFEMVSDPRCHDDPAVRAELALSLARAAGARGMVLGQALDMAAERADTPLDLQQITALQAGKTGALIEWAATAGPVMAGDDAAALRSYARNLGLAFQIADDILDVEGASGKIGKTSGKDVASGKPTYPAFFGITKSRQLAELSIDRAKHSLASANLDGHLNSIADWVFLRTN